MANLEKRLTAVLEEKRRVDERAKHIGLEVLSEWVDEQLALCTTEDWVVTRDSVQESQAMSGELFTALSATLGMDHNGILSQANTVLRHAVSSRGVLVSGLARFDTYALSIPPTIILQYKH